MRPPERDDLEPLATFVHGATAAFHLIGLAYNLRRGNHLDATAHLLGVLYDTAAMRRHLRKCRKVTM